MSTSEHTSTTPLGAEGVGHLAERVRQAAPPFYRQAAGQLGGGAALGTVPATERHAMLADQLAHLPHGTRRFADAGVPIRTGKTGTGAELLVLTWTAADLAREVEAGARVFRRLGVAAGMRVANALPGALVTPGALLLGDVIEAIGAMDVPLGLVDGPAAAKGAWELLDRVEPAILVLNETSATHLFAHQPAAARPWWRGIVWLRTSEQAPGARPAVPATFDGWQRTWLAVPEATSFVGHEVAPGTFQVDEGVHAEVADGRLLLTPLGREAALLRYASPVAVRSQDVAAGTITLG